MSSISSSHADVYRGRFAPSPTGPLHAGSLVAALASWLDARAHGGEWLVRIEDVDSARCTPAAAQRILQQLAACGLHCDAPPVWQSQRRSAYQGALQELIDKKWAYACACSRKEIEAHLRQKGLHKVRNSALVYPGTCRNGTQGAIAHTWRMRTQAPSVRWSDRRLGPQQQDVEVEVGDFVLLRADACFSYQLAVIVDDAAQRITHVVRGEDLADNTARQILLQRALGLPTPQYLHTSLVRNMHGEKLSKQNGAPALDTSGPAAALSALEQAAAVLGLQKNSDNSKAYETIEQALALWIGIWRSLYCI